MLNRTNNLLTGRNLPLQSSCGNHAIQLDSEQFIEEISNGLLNGTSQLPAQPGFEKHPYKGVLENIDARKYIMGTFPPISYLIDTLQNQNHTIGSLRQPTHPNQIISEPKIPFFHGNVSGLWNVLLPEQDYVTLSRFNNREAAKSYLINWLISNDIHYDDIVSYTQRKLGKLNPQDNLGYTYEDVNLKNICPDQNLVKQLLYHSTLNVVCFTNGATFRSGQNGGLQLYEQVSRLGLVRTGNSDTLSLFLRTCQDIGLRIDMRCLPHFDWVAIEHLNSVQKRTKLIFELRITKTKACTMEGLQTFSQKTFTAITPFSPAAHGNIETHPIVLNFRTVNGHLSISQILHLIYEKFRMDKHEELYQYNINQ